ncbi:MAG: ABC transporter permease [Minisyncoccia bacterium]
MNPNPALIGYWTMVRKEVIRIIRIWSQTLLPPVVTTTLYFIVFGTFIGSQLASVSGHSYMQFIVPGLVMMSLITSSYMNTVSTFYFAKWQRTIDELLVSPMPSWVVMMGFVSGGVIRAGLVGILVVLISLFFTHIAVYNIFVVFIAAFLTAFLFALAGLVNGFFAKSFDAISIVPTFVLTPLTYLGGVFYSIDQLPPFFRALSLANPILYMVNLFRYGFLGVSDVNVWLAFGVLLGFSIGFFLLTFWLFKRGKGLKN